MFCATGLLLFWTIFIPSVKCMAPVLNIYDIKWVKWVYGNICLFFYQIQRRYDKVRSECLQQRSDLLKDIKGTDQSLQSSFTLEQIAPSLSILPPRTQVCFYITNLRVHTTNLPIVTNFLMTWIYITLYYHNHEIALCLFKPILVILLNSSAVSMHDRLYKCTRLLSILLIKPHTLAHNSNFKLYLTNYRAHACTGAFDHTVAQPTYTESPVSFLTGGTIWVLRLILLKHINIIETQLKVQSSMRWSI